jgi:hypothetical protein
MIVVFCLVACKLYSLYLEIQSYSVALSALACASRESRVVTRQRVESDEFEPPGISIVNAAYPPRATVRSLLTRPGDSADSLARASALI